MTNCVDIIIFGATGFTGKFTIPKVHKLVKANGAALTWGIAGRSETKLKKILVESAQRIEIASLNAIPIVIADVHNEESIRQMTAHAKVIINCCGPYDLYGEVVVKSCVETGTHYVDVSAESLFIRDMEEKYHKAAEEKGVYIVNACGFDAVAVDLGLIFLENNFEGSLNSVDVYCRGQEEGEVLGGSPINYATWESLVHMVGRIGEILALTKNRNLKLPQVHPKLSLRHLLGKTDIGGQGYKWTIPFKPFDYDRMVWSQQFFYEHDNKRPIQIQHYLLLDSITTIVKFMFFGLFLAILTQFKYGRGLLLKYPELFSMGYVSRENPPDNRPDHLKFTLTFHGVGWGEKLTNGADQYQTSPDKEIVARISGNNPGYGFACTAVTLCAIIIVTEREKLPAKGGVYSPAAAFSKTSLIEQLQRNGTTYEIISRSLEK